MHDFDTVITNGTVVDPEKKCVTVASLGIRDGKIAAVTRERLSARHVLDAAGKIVSPGFIDIHTHVEGKADCAGYMAAMGVTTVYNGNCGISPPGAMEDFFGRYEREGFLINQLEQAGHTSLREAVGLTDRYAPASQVQTAGMIALLEKAFDIGAWGLSFGLEYVPGSSAEEVLALARTAARYGKLVSIHTRTDGYRGLAALKEAIDITRLTGAAVNISHFVYQYGFGMAVQALAMLDDAQREGLDISVDSGVYTSFATSIGSAVFDDGCLQKWGCGYDSIVAATGKYRGKRLTDEEFHELRADAPDDTAIALIGKEHEIWEILERPGVMLSSDAGTMYEGAIPGHPQDAGTFPRFFRTMVREQNRLSLPEAVARCTSLPAGRLGLKNKGKIKEGADADIVVFDPDRIRDNAQLPCDGDTSARPDGIDYVLVGGELAADHGELKPVKPGKLLRGRGTLWNR
ncbi:N-acyl-D-amino-acid deacylase [Sporobacter termitidis DSM 10068]|uniref:N-acyl-D-amino-acid deacylase n=1 Tax=Sporobacter termitidis DSM 10068 TaxID=1123282 RepID=A0A1M5XE36_9FIRM|nr:amidohydrolase family protein [Sporobacter termitidis]SHH98046.1 N-acyl-D-amino-acid deacylase [Sporobacter termitidis DSM 10068]